MYNNKAKGINKDQILNSEIEEKIYVSQPLDFINSEFFYHTKKMVKGTINESLEWMINIFYEKKYNK